MRLIYIAVLMLLPTLAFSQEKAFYIGFKDKALKTVLKEVEQTYDVLFSYKDILINNKTVSLSRQRRTLAQTLEVLRLLTQLNFEILENRYIIVSPLEDVTINVEQLDKVLIKSYITTGIEKRQDGSFVLFPSKLGILPGLTESDVLESIQLLPGVLSPNETASGLFVRGGYADQNRLIWDGINLYHKGHLFGMISPLNPNVASEIKFINKGTNPRYGERLSSVTDISSKSSISEDLKVGIGANAINTDAVVELPIVNKKLSVQASLRRSYTDILETFTFNQLTDKVFESTKISQDNSGNNDFSFMDYNIKLNYKPNASNYVYASMISIDNQLDYRSRDNSTNKTFTDELDIKNVGYGLGWSSNFNPKLSLNSQVFFSDYRLDYDFITAENEVSVSDFKKQNAIFDSGVSTELNFVSSNTFKYTLGYHYTLKDVSFIFVNEEDLRFVLDTEQSIVQSHSVYGNVDYNSSGGLSISFGLRNTYFKELDAVRVEPRLLVLKTLNNHFKLQASAEIKNQILSEIDETVFSDLSLENRVWRLVDGQYFPIINSKHGSLGFIYSKRGFSLDADMYYKEQRNISALSLGFLNPENTGFNIGNQNIFGTDVFLKRRFKSFNSWISYSYNEAKSTFNSLNDNKSFNSRTNITHALSAALSYSLDNFQVALGWKWQTGRPYTIAENGADGLEFNNGINTGELPVYHRLDLSATHSFNFSAKHKLKGKIGLSVRNLYNRANIISREYRGNNSLNDPVQLIERYSLGFTPNFMFRVYW